MRPSGEAGRAPLYQKENKRLAAHCYNDVYRDLGAASGHQVEPVIGGGRRGTVILSAKQALDS